MDALTDRARALRRNVRFVLSLRVLPGSVARFYWRAHRLALRAEDQFSLDSAARPPELAELLALARGRSAVVELGTGSAWTAIALALDSSERRVVTYDPFVREHREDYLALAGSGIGERVEFRHESDSRGPRPGDAPVELLFVDSEHERDPVVRAFTAWNDALADGAVVAFHDYEHPDYPGVRKAIEDLGLVGQNIGGLFVWRAPESVARPDVA